MYKQGENSVTDIRDMCEINDRGFICYNIAHLTSGGHRRQY